MKAIRKIECHHVLDGPVDASFSYSPGYLDLAYRYIPTNKEPEQQPNIFQTLFLFGGSQKNAFILSFSGNSKKPAPTLWFVNHDWGKGTRLFFKPLHNEFHSINVQFAALDLPERLSSD